jgi:hypothetical protein
MRIRERAVSTRLTASTPASASSFAGSTTSFAPQLCGGKISTETTCCPDASLAPHAERSRRGTGSTVAGSVATDTRAVPRARSSARRPRPPSSRLVHDGPDRPDMPWSCAAAAADEPHAQLDHAARVLGHVLRAREVDLPVAHGPGQPRVRLRREGQRRGLGHLLDRVEQHGGPHGAVEADHVRPDLRQGVAMCVASVP